MEKKSLIILQSDLNNHIDIANQILSIISSQATSLGRFEIIDRNLVTEILAEQKFQLSGMINDENIIEIGNMASADEALILKIIQFNQKGVPREDDKKDDKDTPKKEKKNLQPLRILSPHSLRLGRLPRDYRAGDEPNRG